MKAISALGLLALAGSALGGPGVEATLVKAGVPRVRARAIVGQMLADLVARVSGTPGAVVARVDGWPTVSPALLPKTARGGDRRVVHLYDPRRAGPGVVKVAGSLVAKPRGGVFDYKIVAAKGRWSLVQVTQTGRL